MPTSIRELSADSESEILLVGQRMRKTLIDVLGEEKGGELYSVETLVDRVRWHLDSVSRIGKVYLSQDDVGNITGQTLARVETDVAGLKFGRFSMVYVLPEYRRRGIATQIISTVENWFHDLAMPKIIYNTAETNQRVIDLFRSRGYRITHAESEMVQMTKILCGP